MWTVLAFDGKEMNTISVIENVSSIQKGFINFSDNSLLCGECSSVLHLTLISVSAELMRRGVNAINEV